MSKKLGFLLSPGIFVLGYTLAVCVWFVVWLTVSDANWVLVLVNRAVVYVFFLIPVLLIISFLFHQRKPTLFLIIPGLVFFWLYHPYLVPKIPTRMSDASILRVMTYNVLYSNTDYDAMADTIQRNQPDLVALQEVLPETMAQLQMRLQEEYPYSLLGMEEDFGVTAVFSRFPFTYSKVLDLQAPRPATIIKTNVGDQEVTFIAAHLRPYNLWWTKPKDIPATIMERTFDQNRQANLLLDELVNEGGIVILGCDCNSYETSSSYRIFDQVLDNSARNIDRLAALDFSAGAKRDLYPWHIDYVWYKGDVTPVGTYKIADSGGSDHLPVLSIFVIDSVEK